MSNDRIDGVPKSPTGPLKLPTFKHVEKPEATEDEPRVHNQRFSKDRQGLGVETWSAVRNTGRLPKLDADDIPEIASNALDALRRPTKPRKAEASDDAMPKSFADVLVAIADMVDGLDESRAKKRDEVMTKLQALIAKILQIPSSGIREMLMGLVAAIMSAAAKGDFDLALNMCIATMTLAQKCEELCDHILKGIHKLKAGLDVKGPAGAMLKAIGDAAERAMNAASSPAELEMVADLVDRAVRLGEMLEDIKPGSKLYMEILVQLASILNALIGMGASDKPDDSALMMAMATMLNMAGDMDQSRKGQLDDLENQVQNALSTILALPSAGTREMLMGMLGAVMNAADKGDFALALNMAAFTMTLAKLCEQLCDHVMNAAHRLCAAHHADGAADRLLKAMGHALEQALRAASSLAELQALAELCDRALGAADRLGGASAGMKVYLETMAEIMRLMAVTLSMITAIALMADDFGADMGDMGGGSRPSGAPELDLSGQGRKKRKVAAT